MKSTTEAVASFKILIVIPALVCDKNILAGVLTIDAQKRK